jgi:hypothetical protein
VGEHGDGGRVLLLDERSGQSRLARAVLSYAVRQIRRRALRRQPGHRAASPSPARTARRRARIASNHSGGEAVAVGPTGGTSNTARTRAEWPRRARL